MKRLILVFVVIILFGGCATSYKVTSEDFKRETMKIRAMNKLLCPIELEGWLTLIKAEVKGKEIFYYYTIPNDYNKKVSKEWFDAYLPLAAPFSWEQINIMAKENQKATNCEGEIGEYVNSIGAVFHYFYTTEDGKNSYSFVVSKESCFSYIKGKPDDVRGTEILNSLCPLKIDDETTLRGIRIKGVSMIIDIKLHDDRFLSPDGKTTKKWKTFGKEFKEEMGYLPQVSPYDAIIQNLYNKRGEFLYRSAWKKKGK